MSAENQGNGAPTRRVSPAHQVFTLFGDYWWNVSEPMPTGALVCALIDLGIKEAAARASLVRLTRLGLLESERVGRRTTHRLSPRSSATVLEEAAWLDDFGRLEPEWDGLWSVVAFSIPESQRSLRHSARSRLKWFGYAPLYDGVWISPLDTVSDVMAVLREIGVADTTTMRARLETTVAGGPRSAWDLDAARAEYDTFRASLLGAADPATPEEALVQRSRLMIGWQRFRSLDVGLPLAVLPAEWPRESVRALFARRYNAWGPLAEDRMREHVSAISPELAPLVRERRLEESAAP
jgi:phenylacetic acid degradation operon negative regulatory protein